MNMLVCDAVAILSDEVAACIAGISKQTDVQAIYMHDKSQPGMHRTCFIVVMEY